MSAPPFMPLYVGDYLADTAHLTTEQHGAYLLLIMHYWRNEGLPDDDDRLARIARMSSRKWRAVRPVLEAMFDPGWKHKRVEFELTEASRISAAGRKGGLASGVKRREQSIANLNDRSTTVQRPDERSVNDPPTKREALHSPSQTEERKVPTSSAADAPGDVRADLFGRGLTSLVRITGKTPDSARSLIGRWLKDVQDEAIHVLAAIEDAERNRVADPVAWINRTLKPHERNGHGKRTVHDAAHDLVERLRSFDEPAPSDLREREGGNPVRLLPTGRRQ